MSDELPIPWLPGADVQNSLADAQQQNNDELINRLRSLAAVPPSRRGIATCTITDGTSAAVTVAHGLGRTPAWGDADAWVGPAGRDDFFASIASWDATNVTINVRGAAAEQFPVGNPTDVPVSWEVMG